MHITSELIQRFDRAGPRYTSYPTADRFVEAFDSTAYTHLLQQRLSDAISQTRPLSLYVHLPFCESLCYYCACNKIITKQHHQVAPYLVYLERELRLITAHIGQQQIVNQLHLGGGSPTFLSDAELTQLMRLLAHYVVLQPEGEYAIEIDPRTVDATRLQHLTELGFNRLSFGVQDFNPAVQTAVHRQQPYAQIAALMHEARQLNLHGINIDLIYGLPLQTPTSFRDTITQVLALRPDRIALYGYAHLPERFKPQRRIDTAQLPSATHKITMLADAITQLTDAGYVYIGMDHFALPSDALAIAKQQGRLHRNFQGYTTSAEGDLIGIGVSAISKVGASYSQNYKTLDQYYDALDQGQLPISKGMTLTRDDLLRRAVIMLIMCQGHVDIASIEQTFLIQFKRYFATEWAQLDDMAQQGMVTLEDMQIDVTELGWYFVRGIAMVFDRYLQYQQQQSSSTTATFSKLI
jgi:oxygen-independent coproporphyrinogen-3 oxidase